MRPISASRAAELRTQLQSLRRRVDFDTYDITVDELVRRVERGRLEIAPSYQRQFRWDEVRQSRLVESVLLGIPVPPLFLATNVEEGAGATWEVVDGLQRLMSLVNFLGSPTARERVSLTDEGLKLTGLEQLEAFNGLTSDRLPQDLLDGLLDRPLKAIVLNDKSDVQVRYDLFERLNTGGVRLTDHEIREAVFPGPFIDLVVELAAEDNFRKVVLLKKSAEKDGTREDFVLRFFAFRENYESFDHSVHDFLLDFTKDATRDPRTEQRKRIFRQAFKLLAETFPHGLKRGTRRLTPVNLYEGVAVGASLALDQNADLTPPSTSSWIESVEMRSYTTGATNDRARVRSRILYSRDHFLRGS